MGQGREKSSNSELRRYRAMLNASRNGIILVDGDDKIVVANTEAERILGYRAEGLHGLSVDVIMSEGNSTQSVGRSIISILRGEQGKVVHGVRKDGSVVCIELAFSDCDTEGDALTAVSIFDLSAEQENRSLQQLNEQLEHKLVELEKLKSETDEAKRALIQTELEFRMLAETVPAAVWTTDAQGRLEYISSYWLDLTGLDLQQSQGEGWVVALHPDERDYVYDKWSESCKTGKAFEEAYRFKQPDGTYRWFLTRGVPLRDGSGELVKWFGVCSDIDDERKLHEELAEARDKAERATKTKSMFLANMSHEVRTPMNAIIGMCNVLLKTELSRSQRQYLENLREAANSLLVVLNDILDFSKIEANQLTLELSDFDPVLVVESTCELLSAAARPKGLTLMARIDPKMPRLLRGDPDRLRQILTNFTSNAIKFADAGEVAVHAEFKSEHDGKIKVLFSVTDDGIGMSADEQSKLFQPFAQASTGRTYGGTGLGLSICRRLVELMGGNIGLTSSPGRGATFWFEVELERRSDASTISEHKELKVCACCSSMTIRMRRKLFLHILKRGACARVWRAL